MNARAVLDGAVLVVDDFYPNPDRVRDFALSVEFIDFEGAANFPGGESRKAFYTPRHPPRFSEIVGTDIDYDPARWVFGKFRSAARGQRGRTRVHIDRTDWTAVVNLSPRPAPRGAGLGLYRHRPSGLDRVPGPDRLNDLGFADLDQFDASVVAAGTWAEDDWELLATVEDRYNRCVVFRGARLFHAILRTYGSGLDDSRLTQNFFFNEGPS